MATNPFSQQNPFGGGTLKKDKPEAKKQNADTPYEQTGEASRDHVRKTFWEIFNTEQGDESGLSNADIVRDLETQIFDNTGSNCKSKEYRDMTKAIQLKLRGSRYVDTRNQIRSKNLEIKDVCTQEFINSKGTGPGGQKPTQPGGTGGAGRGRGLPMAGGRGRGAPMGRGRGMPPMMGGQGRPGPARPAQPVSSKPPIEQIRPEENQQNEIQQPTKQNENEEINKIKSEEPQNAIEQNQESINEQKEEKEDRPMQMPQKRNVKPPQMPQMRQAQMNDTTLTDADQSKVMLQFDDSIVEKKDEKIEENLNKVTSGSAAGGSSSKNLDESKDAHQIQASLDDSQDVINTQEMRPGKKKKKKKKKVDKSLMYDLPTQPNPQIIQQLEDQIKQQEEEQKQEVNEQKQVEPQALPSEPLQAEKEEQKPKIQKKEVVEEQNPKLEDKKIENNEIIEKVEIQKIEEKKVVPEEMNKVEVNQIHDQKQEQPPVPQNEESKNSQKAEIGKLTKQNLDQQFKNTQRLDLPDIETESIMIQESQMSPKVTEIKSNQNKFQRNPSERSTKQQLKAVGEQILNNAATIKSKSLTQSQMGAQESENIRRVQEALQSKKEINLELNQKIMNLEKEQLIRNKKQQLIQDENAQLKEKVRQLQRENALQAEKLREAQNDLMKTNSHMHRQIKEMEEVINAQNSEIDHLKHERDTYKDRFQRSLRDSQTHREQLERSINNQSFQNILMSIKQNGQFSQNSQTHHNEGSSLIGQSQHPSASNQQEINLQKEITELKSKYEKQLREQRHELVQRTRDLQKVERKNIKYRENNRVLSEAVQGLENRNISMIAGSGGVNQDPIMIYENVLRETNEDMIETIDQYDDIDGNMNYDNNNDVIQPRNRDNGHNQNEASNAGLFNQVSELNSGEMGQVRRTGGLGGSAYFENTQDEATGGESHYNNALEEEKVSVQHNQQYIDNDIHIDQQSSSLVQDFNHNENEVIQMQNNNQSNEIERDGQSKGIVKQAYNNRSNYQHQTASAVQQVTHSRNSDMRDQSQLNENSNDIKNSHSENSDGEIITGDDDQSEDTQFNDDSGDSQDSQDDVSQDSNDFNHEMHDDHNDINQRVPGAGSGNQELIGRGQMGHIGPGAIQQNQHMGQRQRQTGSNASGSMRYNHGNMPHQVQQHNQQYNMGSSGTQGINYSSNNEIFVSGTGSGGAAGEAGSSNKTAQRRNRRGYRQQNQQPSSGANDRDLNRRQNRNNRQGRQDGQEGGRGGMNNGNSQSYEDQNLNIGGDNRGRPPQRTSNRGRQQNNQQQQPQQIHNREGSSNIGGTSQQSNQVASQGQSTSLQPEPASVSQEREQQNFNNNNRFGGAAGNRHHDNSQAVQQVVNNLTNYNQNIPASTQSFRTHGAAQSSSMMPASTASHSSSNYHQSALPQNMSASAPHGGPHGYTGVVQHAHQNNQNQGIHFDSGSTSHNPNSQSNQQISNRNSARPNRQGATLSAQVSSSPSTQVIANQTQQNRQQHQSNDQQNSYLLQSDLMGPGAVGAPPSISPPAAQNQDQQVQQNVSPGSQVNTGQGQAQQNNRNQPTVASVQNENQQQSLNTIPASVFGAGSGGGQETSHSGALQAPAALGTSNYNYGGSGDPQERNNVVHQIGSGGNLFDDQQYSTINFNNMQDPQQNQTNRNNDSRKTSGANTPSKDGAITPKTQQQHHGHSGGGQAQSSQEFNSAVSVGLNSHLNNQSNQQNFIHNLAIIGQSSNNERQGRQTQANQNKQPQNQNVSIIDQLSAAAQRDTNQNNNPISFLDDFTGGHQHIENEELVMGGEEQQQPSSLLGGDSSAANLIPNNMFD